MTRTQSSSCRTRLAQATRKPSWMRCTDSTTTTQRSAGCGRTPHYKSMPYFPQANGRAERVSRLMIGSTRSLLLTSGLNEKWWVLAIVHFCMNYKASFVGKDGLTPWQRRFSTNPDFVVYPFGALVLYKHPNDAPVPKTGSNTKTTTRK